MPLIKFPIVGDINYFNNGKGDGVIVLVLALISLACVILNRCKFLWFTGTGSFLMLFVTLFTFLNKMSQARADMEFQLSGNPFRGLADMAIQSIQLQWGWAMLVIGSSLLILSAAIKEQSEVKSKNDNLVSFNRSNTIKLLGNDQSEPKGANHNATQKEIMEIQQVRENNHYYSAITDDETIHHKDSKIEKRARAILRKCNACGRMISRKAKTCHYCGVPIERKTSPWAWIILIVLSLCIIGYISNLSKTSPISYHPASSNNNFFDQPDKLCNALDLQALQTKGWKPSNAIPGEFICMTPLVPIGLPGSNGMENNIAYYVNGTQAVRANDIRVKININNPSERAQAFDRLSIATKTLFKAIEEPVPIELSEALTAEKPISLDTAFGKVELIHEPGNIDSFKIVLTDKRFLASRQAAKVMFADDFEACRSAVAKAAGYGVSSITGDGQPINESDHRSFLLNGKSNDIFFCEMYPGRKYKIKAALGGKFPFKYIAEGVL